MQPLFQLKRINKEDIQMNQLNSMKELLLQPGVIIENNTRTSETTDPTVGRYQVCGIAEDEQGHYVVVYQELFGDRAVHTMRIQAYLGTEEVLVPLSKPRIVPKFHVCTESVDVPQSVVPTKPNNNENLIKEIESLRKEIKTMQRNLKKLHKLTEPLKSVQKAKGKARSITSPIDHMPLIPTPKIDVGDLVPFVPTEDNKKTIMPTTPGSITIPLDPTIAKDSHLKKEEK